MRSFQKLLKGCQTGREMRALKWMCIHRSLLVSISPNSSLLPPLLDVAAEVADAAEETVEKEEDGLLARTCPEGLSCLQLIVRERGH